MASGVFKWTPKYEKWASQFLSQWNRKVGQLEYADSVVGLATDIPKRIDKSFLKSHIGSKSDLNSFQKRLEALQSTKNQKDMQWIDTPRGRMRVPKAMETAPGRFELVPEVASKKREAKRQSRKARREVEKSGAKIPVETHVQITKEVAKVLTADELFSNNRNVESLAEKYLEMAAEYDEDKMLTDTVDIVNWYIENAPEKLSDIYDGSTMVPEIEYIYETLYNYSASKRRASSGVKTRKTKTGLPSTVNSAAKVNRINQWWKNRFRQDFGLNWE